MNFAIIAASSGFSDSNGFLKGCAMLRAEYEIVKSAPLEEIVDLYKSAGWWQESPEARAVIPSMIHGSFCFMVARTLEGRIIGMGRVISDGCSDAYIQDVVVLQDYRGQKVGRELVRRLTRFCSARKISWIGLVAEPGTQGMYEDLGFGPLIGYQPMLFGKRP
jgi:ribosomal protein S18 acetylase RimI-like enzyme